MDRIIKEYGIPKGDAVILTKEKSVSDYFIKCASLCRDRNRASKWIIKELFKLLNTASMSIETCPIIPEQFSRLINLLSDGDITDSIGRTVLESMFDTGREPEDIINEKGLKPVQDIEMLREIASEVIEENPGPVSQIRQGETKTIGYLIGQVMNKTGGRAHPKKTRELIDEGIRE